MSSFSSGFFFRRLSKREFGVADFDAEFVDPENYASQRFSKQHQSWLETEPTEHILENYSNFIHVQLLRKSALLTPHGRLL
jgi:protein-tyrosine phosphatase